MASSHGSTAAQAATAATYATSQTVANTVGAQSAQVSLQHSIQVLQAMQSAQAAARFSAASGANNLGLNPNSSGQSLPNINDGLAAGALVPGVQGIDPADPTSVAKIVPVTANGNGTSSVSLAANSAITLPGNGAANIIASGSGVVGTITTAGIITPLTGGVTVSVSPGSTISITRSAGSTVTFGGGSVGIPATFATYNYGSGSSTSPVPSSWSGIGGLTQATYTAQSGQAPQTTVTLTQTAQQALLQWQSFNVGKNTTLDFDQAQGGANVGQWVAINQITDPSLAPSQILGAIHAPGQVYVINQNGIIFGGSSQVNVGALTASSLALNPAYIANGLLNDAGNGYQFQFSSLFTTTTAKTGPRGHQVLTTTVAPLWTAPPAVASGGSQTVSSVPTGDVTVQAGAQLTSPVNAENQGGRVALIAPNVVNNGTISTPDGQTILAAGLQVGFAAHNADDASLRGLDVYVGQVSGVSSTLPTGTFTYNGLPNNDELTFAGSGQVGTYTAPNSTTPVALTAGTPVAIPVGSVVNLTSGAPSYAAVQGGTVTNGSIGDIEASEADVTMTGQTVNQLGFINSATSVTLNGRIDLLADYDDEAGLSGGVTTFYPTMSGTVNLGSQSVTQILPEDGSADTTIGTTLAVSSLVNIQGLNINMLPDALILAPSANQPSSSSSPALDLTGQASAELKSGITFNAGTWSITGTVPGSETSTFSNGAGQITIGTGAVIDVSGSEDVSASVEQNIIPVQLRGPELADSPLQQDGALRGDTVYIDIRDSGVYDGTAWIGTPIGDVSGYVNDVQRTVGQLTTNGGTVALNAGGSVNIGTGSTINVSGGWINYAGGFIQTTKVISNGQILDISQATPNLIYQGIYNGFSSTSAKWGVTDTFVNRLLSGSEYEAGYIQGGSGGTVSISAPAVTMGGNLYGNTSAGVFQRTPAATVNATYSDAPFLPTTLAISGVPLASALDLSFLQPKVGSSLDVYQTTSPDIEFETDSFISQNTPAANQLFLSEDIVNTDGFGILKLDTTASGTITVPAGISLDTSSGGQISFEAANITIDGSISAPSGTLSFDVFDISPTDSVQFTTPAADPTRGLFILGAGASLSSTGLIVDDRPGTTSPSALPFATGGGKISIAGLDVNLAAGSTIDVSGGLSIDSSGNETYGNAGSISILGGQDPRIASLVNGGELFLGSTLAGYSGAVGGGGTLTIQAPLVQIGGSSLLNGDSSSHAFVQGEASVTGNGTTLWLDPAAESSTDFFSQGGFETFTIEGLGQIETTSNGAYMFNTAGDPVISPAVLIASGTNISPVVQSYAADFTGTNIKLSPLASGQESRLLSSQRTPVNLIFNAEGVSSNLSNDGPPEADGTTYLNSGGGSGLLVRGDLVMQAGSSITTAPQTNSSHGVSLLAAHGMVAVLGSINAPAGTITITGGNTASVTNNQLLFYESSLTQPFPTVDLGPGSVLSTAGVMEQTPNSLGFTTGSVLAGGNIVINGNIVAEQGATLDVSGASGVVDQTLVSLGQSIGRITSAGYVPTTVESNGGSITFNASQLLYSDATLLGSAGGPSAQGGTLSVSSGFADTVLSSTTPPVPQDISLIVSQQGLNGGFSLPADSGSGLAVVDGQAIPGSDSEVGATINNTYGGEPVYSYFAANSNLFVSTTSNHAASNNGGHAGGFSSLNLAGTLDFIGPVNITASRSINLAQSSGNTSSGETGGVIYADSPVVVTAPYVALNSYITASEPDQITGYPVALGGTGTLTVNASTLADVGNLSLQDISTLNFNTIPGLGGDIRGNGTLQVADQINLNAAQIYPPTADTFTIEANDVSITAPTGQALPYLPFSAGGTLDIYADNIEQGGVLRAPFGIINLGTSATQSITLSSGSITSVSGVDPRTGLGITVPYGIVDDNGTWYDPNGNKISLTGPIAKAVNVTSQNVDLQSGSTIDLAGGGNLFAYQFTPGTGGNKDILASTGSGFSSTSFAIVPGYSSSYGYAPDGTYAISDNLLTNNVQDIGYYNSSLAVGEQIHLNASSGLPAGTYTLLPARYALLPGAFLVSATSGGAPGTSILQSDGSSFVSGYVTSALNSTASPIYSSFQLYSQANVLNRAPYTINLANTYFPSEAANNDLSVPRLPIDSGQLLLDATQSMTIQGTLLSQAPVGGLGGEVDIASPEAIYIVAPNTVADAPTGSLVLDSSQLTDFGAASLLIGGYRTTTDTGTSVTVTTSDLVVDNSGASTVVNGVSVAGLAAPDIILASNANLEVDSGSAIEQLGQLSGGAQALTLQGDGVLLRLSSDPSASIVRQNVSSGDTTSALSIGQGVTIRDANGGAAGSLTLDSSSLLSISTSTAAPPVLSATVLTLDSSLINIELGTPATAPTSGLVITQPLLDSLLSSTQSLSLLSYSSIALYGSGEIGSVSIDESGQKTYQEQNLSLHADEIYYADTQDSSGITINAQNVSLDNLSDGTLLPSLGGLGASNLTVNAQTISLGSNAMRMDQFTSVALNADSAILLRGLGSEVSGSDNAPTPASLNVGGNLTLTTPLITSATAPDQTVTDTTSVELDEAINATGALTIEAPVNDLAAFPGTGELGATLSLSGGSIAQNSGSIVLHSGKIDLQATGVSASPGAGAILVNGTLDVSGVAPTFFSLNKFTDGGQIALNSLNGNVAMGSNGLINVSAVSGPGTVDSGAGSAGSLTISAAGLFTPGLLVGGAGQVTQSGAVIAQGFGGTLSLDVGSLDASGAGNGLLSSLENSFVGFDQQSIRDRNDSTVTVDDTVRVSNFDLSTDTGSINVTGTINASNVATTDAAGNLIYVGGSIELDAGANVILAPTSVLNASGINFSDAGKGGSITLVSGAYRNVKGADVTDYNGYVDIQGNSTSAAQINLSVAANNGAADNGDSVALGHYTGTLLIEAPRTADNTGVQVRPLDGTIIGESSITVAGNEIYTTDAAGDINGNGVDLPTQIKTDGQNFLGMAGQPASANYSAMASSLFGNLDAASQNVASIEAGVEIVNPSGDLNLASNWDLSTFRFGPTSGAGVLTLRAAANINVDFGASLTDGFDGSSGVGYTNVLLPAGSQSWSYNLVSGADLSAANASQVQTASQLQLSGLDGSLQLGYQSGSAPIVVSNSTIDDPSQFFQTIRTGTGNISISAGGGVLLLNELATIYTAGSQVDPTLGGTFVAPSGTGLNQQALPATYSAGGGNVVIAAQGNIERETYGGSSGTQLVADSSPELPTNWLDREGSVSAGIPTTWWVDFTNFFEGVGALGGGNVSLTAQGSVVNVDTAIPTNGRVVNGALTELGGGDLVVRAGNNIDGGVYYVEQGQGTVAAGNNVLTNATRAAVSIGEPSTSLDWLPTTLFLGTGDFSVSAGGNLLLGPVANPFLLPQSFNNVASPLDLTSELSYFSTYASTDAVNASSLTGTLTIQDFADGQAQGSLYSWYTNILDSSVTSPQLGSVLSAAEPWLRLAEATTPQHIVSYFGAAGTLPLGSPSNVFGGVTALMPPTLRATAFSGDLDLIGSLTLSPSASGSVDLIAAGSINAFQTNADLVAGVVIEYSGSALVNLSDANPNALPGINDPLTSASQLVTLDPLFTDTGATEGLTLQTKQKLHANVNGGTLHSADSNPDPVYIYADTGNISGLTLFSAKQAQVIAGQNISDIGLYIQNNNSSDISVVSAGRDIIAYDANSPLRIAAGTNLLGYDPQSELLGEGAGAPNSGDIQISGPGTLEVLTGRNLTLGNDAGQNPNASVAGDGLDTGLTSVGGQLNPALPFDGANIVAAAGLGTGLAVAGLEAQNDSLTFSTFISEFLNPASSLASTYLPDLASYLGLGDSSNQQIWSNFNSFSSAHQDTLALDIFYRVLSDTATNHNDPTSSGFGNYNTGFQAVSALFPANNPYQGDINLTSREVKTSNGGDIDLLVPGGQVTVGVDQANGQAVDQGILTVDDGNVNIFGSGSVLVGTSRIFTLHGGNETIWSTNGNIDAGASSKTVVSAPPTRVVVDPTSGAVTTDLAGLSTGGGIGVLASVVGAPPGNIYLIAPNGTVDAGDAGIRASGNIDIAAQTIANASNISSGGSTTGVSAGASVNLGALSAASSAAGSSEAAANNSTPGHQNVAASTQDTPSIITVEVLGYGGGDND